MEAACLAVTSLGSGMMMMFRLVLMAFILTISIRATDAAVFRPSPWQLANATFYGDETASDTMGISSSSPHICHRIGLHAL